MNPEKHISTELPKLTCSEQAALVSGANSWQTRPLPRVHLRAITCADGPHGVRYQPATGEQIGIGESAPATCFPTAAATGSSWNPRLLAEIGHALGQEAREFGINILLGPGVNLKRSPLCGRNFEYFSEDPLLAGTLGAAWVKGLQACGVGASVKHFAANNQETERMRVNVEVSERALRELYLAAFERIVRTAKPATIMAAYNRINGEYACENPHLLRDILRDDWGFTGAVISDWGAVTDPVRAIAAGLDLEMPSTGDASPRRLETAVTTGELSPSALATSAEHVRSLVQRCDDWEQQIAHTPVDFAQHHRLAHKAACESMVLLKNVADTLPLIPDAGGRIAVIGEFARTPRYQGAGSSQVVPTELTAALDAMRARSEREIVFAPGFLMSEAAAQPGSEAAQTAAQLRQEAVEIAANAEVVVLFLGLPAAAESEGFDRTTLDLPQPQIELFSAIVAANPNVIVVLSNGAVVNLEPLVDDAAAILETWLGGQAGGSATADVLFGRAEPSGRLAESIPKRLEHTPAYVNWPGTRETVRYGEDIFIGYRWYEMTQREVRYPFGYGLGYTRFAYRDLRVKVPNPTVARAVVEVTVENIGSRPGAEVVQLYVADHATKAIRPPHELRAFQKVFLQPHAQTTIEFPLSQRAFAYWGEQGWQVDPGEFEVQIGSNSRDIHLRERIELRVPQHQVALTTRSTLQEWLADERGRVILIGAVKTLLGGAVPGTERGASRGGTGSGASRGGTGSGAYAEFAITAATPMPLLDDAGLALLGGAPLPALLNCIFQHVREQQPQLQLPTPEDLAHVLVDQLEQMRD